MFIDLDMTNSFHQIPIDEDTGKLLSVISPFGVFQPMFLPEGVVCASAILQKTVRAIFEKLGDCDWFFCLYDNFLIGCNDYAEGLERMKLVFELAREANLIFKQAKSHLFVKEVEFFGFIIGNGGYRLSEERRMEVYNWPFPTNISAVRSFLGVTNYFGPTVEKLAIINAPISDMLKDDFDWNSVKVDSSPQHAAFAEVKEAILKSHTVCFPDYTLQWILRCDACDTGCGAVLLMVVPLESGGTAEKILGVHSRKFSEGAKKWAVNKKEAYALYDGVCHFEDLIRCKPLALQTDHRNLQWMKNSPDPLIIRWCLKLQQFPLYIQYIPGKLNVVADWLSRLWTEDPQPTVASVHLDTAAPLAAKELVASESQLWLLKQAHELRHMHLGVASTWRNCNEISPGHGIPYRLVADYVDSCAVCQKVRNGLKDTLVPIYRTVVPPFGYPSHWC
jgi:hypothetical protein